MIARRLAACAAALALAGCGAADPGMASTSPTVSSDPASSASPPPGVATLGDFAIEHGPAGFPLPEGLMISYTVDNPNNVTLVIDEGQGDSTYRFLRAHLVGAGFRITADGQKSLTFDGRGWEGAYTVSATAAALTLRTP